MGRKRNDQTKIAHGSNIKETHKQQFKWFGHLMKMNNSAIKMNNSAIKMNNSVIIPTGIR